MVAFSQLNHCYSIRGKETPGRSSLIVEYSTAHNALCCVLQFCSPRQRQAATGVAQLKSNGREERKFQISPTPSKSSKASQQETLRSAFSLYFSPQTCFSSSIAGHLSGLYCQQPSTRSKARPLHASFGFHVSLQQKCNLKPTGCLEDSKIVACTFVELCLPSTA